MSCRRGQLPKDSVNRCSSLLSLGKEGDPPLVEISRPTVVQVAADVDISALTFEYFGGRQTQRGAV